MQLGAFGRRQGLPEGFVFFLRKGAVQIIGPALAVPRRPIDLAHIQRVDGDDGSRGVVKMEVIGAGHSPYRFGHGVTGQRPRGDDADLVVRQLRNFFISYRNERMVPQPVRYELAERHAVYR